MLAVVSNLDRFLSFGEPARSSISVNRLSSLNQNVGDSVRGQCNARGWESEQVKLVRPKSGEVETFMKTNCRYGRSDEENPCSFTSPPRIASQ